MTIWEVKKNKVLKEKSSLLPFFRKGIVEAGLDEAGRGCLAGPVTAAACILPSDFKHDILNDSKKLSKKQRELIAEDIKAAAVAYAVAEVSPQEIDEINILNASFLAMHRALDALSTKPELLLIDGNRFNAYTGIPHECIIKGDGKFFSIAAASVLAKTHRDQTMSDFAKTYPGYGWETNAGYPTIKHREAIKQLGVTPLHRKSFQLLSRQREIF